MKNINIGKLINAKPCLGRNSYYTLSKKKIYYLIGAIIFPRYIFYQEYTLSSKTVGSGWFPHEKHL